ncbi:MAG: ABC transporter ATP-binding protein/permease [Dehalococcoidia bacterium]|nr:ABC transporter ATP-binding protein/permease [Dehalococcoidia bacterium]
MNNHVLVRLLGFTWHYKRQLFLTLGTTLGSGVAALALPTIVGYALDRALAQNADGVLHLQPLLIAAGVLGAVAVLRAGFAYGQQYMGELLGQSVAYRLRNAMYERLQRLSFAYHDEAQIGQIMSRATQDVEAVRMFVNMGVVRLLYLVILLLLALLMMARSSLTLAFAAWSFMPVIAVISIVLSQRLRPLWTEVQDAQGRMSNVLQEALSGVRVVKAFNREDHEQRKFRRDTTALFETAYKTNKIQAFNNPLMTSLNSAALVVTAVVGAHEIVNGNLTPGQLTTFMVYVQILQQPVRMLGFMVNIFARTSSAGERVFEVIDAESAVQEKPDAVALGRVQGHVEFRDVSFGYRQAPQVLDGVSLEAHPGDVVALVGPTGSGKSSLVNLMPRFYDVTGGAVLVDGHDVRDVTIASLRDSIGIVQQDVFLFIDTVRENIRYGRLEATDEEVEAAAKVARIHDFIMSLPDGYETWVGERGVTLSGGQKQRISIARTLLLDPAILILDDSTSSVDMETEYLIQQALQDLMQGRTTFVIAQRLRTVRDADQVLVLDRGRIVQRGKHEDLVRQEGIYQRIYDLELKDQEEAFTQLQEGVQAPPGHAGPSTVTGA